MAGPWEKYQTETAPKKPWEKYRATPAATQTPQQPANPDLARLQQLSMSGDKDQLRAVNQRNIDNEVVRKRPQPDPMAIYGDPSDNMMERSISLMNGVSWGTGDEIAGAMMGDSVKRFYRDALERDRDERPVQSIALEMLGGGATGGGVAGGARAAGVKLGAGAGGAIAGATYGFADGNGDLKDRAADAGLGAAFGGIGGKLFEKAGNIAGRAVSGVRGRRPPINPADEFNIRLTEGQMTDDIAQRSFETAATRGARGSEATQIMRPFMEDQRQAVLNAGRSIAGDTFENVNDAGRAVSAGIRARADDADEAVNAAYEAARRYNARMRGEGVQQLADAVQQGIPEDIRYLMQANPQIAQAQFPATTSAMNASRALAQEVAERSTGDTTVAALDFRRIELARRAMNRAIDGAGNRADRAGAIAAKRSFDDFLDTAVDQGMFEGDNAFMGAYKQARQQRADYARNFEANKLIESIRNNEANEVQVVNYLFGSGTVSNNQRTAQVIPQLKRALGTDSPEWGAIKETAMKRLMTQTERTYNPKVMADNLREATEGKLAPVFRELMTPDELAAMGRLEQVVRKIVPPDGTVNTSNTAYEIQRLTSEMSNGLKWQLRYPLRLLSRVVDGAKPDPNVQRAQRAVGMRSNPLDSLPPPPPGMPGGPMGYLLGQQGYDRLGLDPDYRRPGNP